MGLRTALGLKKPKSDAQQPAPQPELLPRETQTPQYIRPAGFREPRDINDVFGKRFRSRYDLAKLTTPGAVGIELGVARGWFSERLLSTGVFAHLYSVDRWDGDRGHDINQYKMALRALAPYRDQSTCLRMFFDEALDLFPDQHFDFIYIDGYAHTGQHGGKTLEDWWPKLKPGGVFSGDDYSQNWPLTMEAVDAFAHSHGVELCVLTPTEIESPLSKDPSWVCLTKELLARESASS